MPLSIFKTLEENGWEKINEERYKDIKAYSLFEKRLWSVDDKILTLCIAKTQPNTIIYYLFFIFDENVHIFPAIYRNKPRHIYLYTANNIYDIGIEVERIADKYRFRCSVLTAIYQNILEALEDFIYVII